MSSKALGAASGLDDLRSSGALKMLFPRCGAERVTGVMVNTAGGVTGGDRLNIAATAGADSRLTLTSQAAERIYRAQPGEVGQISTRLQLHDGARLDWLPQETILFDRSALNRSLQIDMAGDATALIVEPLVFGRAAMGETVSDAALHDRIHLRRDGKLIFADTLHLSGDVQAHLTRPAVAAGAGAMAGILFAGPQAETHLAPLRALMPPTGGVSLIRPGLLFARLLAPDSFVLRQTLVPVLTRLNGGALPRTWML